MTENTMRKMAGVRFRENWKVYDFDATDIDVAVGDRVIVDSERGPGFAHVVRIRKAPALVAVEPPAEPVSAPEIPDGVEIDIDDVGKNPAPAPQAGGQAPKGSRKIIRKATDDDIAREGKNREREAEAFSLAQEMIPGRELPMKLIRVEYSFDASRATFFFFSETRIDFRELVKDLAFKLKCRIEMRQIGVRDVARMIGGFGPCGRELCCSSFLKNFEPVSIRMAKKQEMVLNPAKISGVCGRLLCCLSYEYEMYDANKRDLADIRMTADKEKKDEEERRIAEERREAEERRRAEEKRRQEDRQQQEQRRQKQPDGQKGGGRHEKRREQQKAEQPRQRQQPAPDRQQAERQTPQPSQAQPQQEGEQAGKRKKRKFWRKKKKKQQGDNKPQGPAGPQSPA